jgi:hypothetical protein
MLPAAKVVCGDAVGKEDFTRQVCNMHSKGSKRSYNEIMVSSRKDTSP